MEEEKPFTNLFYEASKVMQIDDEKFPVFLVNRDTNILNKILPNKI